MVAIFVAFMFVSLVLTDLGVEKWRAWQAARVARPAEGSGARSFDTLWQVPEGVHVSSAHTWFRPNPAGGLEVGADSLIAYAVGALKGIALPKPGGCVAAGQPLFRLERDGGSLTVPSTFTATVAAVNTRLAEEPGLLNSDPYGSGWICRITPTSVGAATPSVRFGEKAVMWLESEFSRLREFLSAQVPSELALGTTSQDGGVPATGCLAELNQEAWKAFEAEFLKMD